MHEVGSIVEGKVTGITKFGAFVELDDGSVGMVHISEISQTYVNDIAEHLKDQQQVKVKILSVNDDGKISLSIKKAAPPTPFVKRDNNKPGGFNNNNRTPAAGGASSGGYNRPQGTGAPRQPFNRTVSTTPKGPATFEDMLTKFMSSSEDKISDMKKTSSSRRGHPKRTTQDYD